MGILRKILIGCIVCLFASISYAAEYVAIGPGGVIGNSTISAYEGKAAVTSLLSAMSTPAITNITDLSDPGDTISNQQAVWQALSSSTRSAMLYVIVEIGLNDLSPGESAATVLTRYQALIDVIKADAPSARVYTATMSPCRERLIDLYGAIDGPVSYQKWLDMNTAIAGGGPNAITGQYGVITQHAADLNDGAGNLAAAYDYGGAFPHIHPDDVGRQLIADAWFAKLTTDLTWHVPDVTAPVVTAFTIPETATSLTVDVSSFTCTDAIGVTGYCITPANSSAACSWSSSAQITTSFASPGSQTAYAWCKDLAGNVSTSVSDSVTITLPPGAAIISIGGTGTVTFGGSGTITLGN